MEKITYIYNIKKENNKVFLEDKLNYELEFFRKNTLKCYQKWKNEEDNLDYYHIATSENIPYPKFDTLNNKIVEKSREEKIIEDGMNELLQPGEFIENGEIVTIPKPKDNKIYKWENNKWVVDVDTQNMQEFNAYMNSENAKLEIIKLDNIINSQTASQAVKNLALEQKLKLQMKIIN